MRIPRTLLLFDVGVVARSGLAGQRANAAPGERTGRRGMGPGARVT